MHCVGHLDVEWCLWTQSGAYGRTEHGNLAANACVMCTGGTRRYGRTKFLPIATDARDAGHFIWTQASGPGGKVFFLMRVEWAACKEILIPRLNLRWMRADLESGLIQEASGSSMHSRHSQTCVLNKTRGLTG